MMLLAQRYERPGWRAGDALAIALAEGLDYKSGRYVVKLDTDGGGFWVFNREFYWACRETYQINARAGRCHAGAA